jgi:hypothetical protein
MSPTKTVVIARAVSHGTSWEATTGPTVAAAIRATADSGPSDMYGLRPRIMYMSSGTTAMLRLTEAETPASEPLAMAWGIMYAPTDTPARMFLAENTEPFVTGVG